MGEVTLQRCSGSLIHKRVQDEWGKLNLKAAEGHRSEPGSTVAVFLLRECTWQRSYALASEAQSPGGLFFSSLKSLFSLGPKQMSDIIWGFFFFKEPQEGR